MPATEAVAELGGTNCVAAYGAETVKVGSEMVEAYSKHTAHAENG